MRDGLASVSYLLYRHQSLKMPPTSSSILSACGRPSGLSNPLKCLEATRTPPVSSQGLLMGCVLYRWSITVGSETYSPENTLLSSSDYRRSSSVLKSSSVVIGCRYGNVLIRKFYRLSWGAFDRELFRITGDFSISCQICILY
jgi:hypothetical protein